MRNGDFLARRCRTKLRCARGLAFYQKATPNHFQREGVSGCSKTFLVFSVRAWLRQHPGQRVQRALELVVIRFAQRGFARLIQHAVQLFQIHIQAGTFHAPSNSRNLRCSGKPSICFTGRVCSMVGARCPRPAVVPITCQLAAR